MGCGIGCLGLLVVVLIIGAVMFVQVRGALKDGQESLEAQGLTLVESEEFVLTITEVPDVPTYYMAPQMVVFNFSEPVDVAIGALAPSVEFSGGEFQENVYAYGLGTVVIMPGCTFKKDLEIQTKLLVNEGTVEGQTTGEYTEME